LPDTELHLLNGGHWTLETNLEEIVTLARDFLERVSQLEPITRSPRLALNAALHHHRRVLFGMKQNPGVTAMDHYLARCSRRGITEAIVTSSSGFRGRIKL
jgi:hypothetical protein